MIRRARSGLVLLIIVGILGVLMMLGTAFVVMAQLERKASQQRTNDCKALLLARSGLEDALARMGLGQDLSLSSNAYGGEDWNGDGILNPGVETADQILQPALLNVDDCPARDAQRPSFFVKDGAGLPALQAVNGRQRGYSGRLSGDLVLDGNQYALKLQAEEGIFVNGGDLGSDGEHAGTYDTVLKRILGNLAQEIGAPLARADAEALVTARPAGGWTGLDQAARTLGWSPAKTLALQPYLVFRAWVDKKVIKPNIDPSWAIPTSGFFGGQTANAWAEIKVGRRDTPANRGTIDPGTSGSGGIGRLWTGRRPFNAYTNSYAPDFERDASGCIVGRAPVNLNWARTRAPVLRALLTGLAGVYLDDYDGASTMTVNGPMGLDTGYLGVFHKRVLSAGDVTGIVSALQAHTGFPTWATDYPEWDQTASFDSWDEFNRFLELKLYAPAPNSWKDFPQAGAVTWSRTALDILRANANPNSDLNKFNPGESFFKRVDKSDLQVYSAEFSLSPSPYKALASCGRLLDARGRTLAERTVTMETAFQQLRLTTQSEFCAGNLGDPQVAGDETLPRQYGDPGFIEESASNDRTYGHRFSPSGRGFSLQTYPEPRWPGPQPCPPPAGYDGHLELATVELDAAPAAMPGLTFLASWDNSYDATMAAGSPTCRLDAAQGSPSGSLMGNGVMFNTALLNMLYPDGCYCESNRTPGYLSQANLGDGLQGIGSFWYKPFPDGWEQTSGVQPLMLSLCHVTTDPVSDLNALNLSQAFNVGAAALGGNLKTRSWGFVVENTRSSADDNHEYGHVFGPIIGGPVSGQPNFWHAHRWYLLTFQWNLLAATAGDYTNVTLNATPHNDSYKSYPDSTAMDYGGNPDGATLTSDGFRGDGSFGPPYFYLGLRGPNFRGFSSADGTMDELAFLTRTTDMNQSSLLASSRFPAGRYCKEDEALVPARPEYTSCPIVLGKGVRLTRVDWTLNLPREPVRPPGVPAEQWTDPSQILYGTGAVPSVGETADATVTLLDAAGNPLVPSRLTKPGSAVGVDLPSGTFKVGVNLRPRLGDNAAPWDKPSAPLLESPVLDDLTFTYTPVQGPRILSWRP